jgi:transposase
LTNRELIWQWLGYMLGMQKGERAKGPKPTKRGKNVSIIGAMSVNEILTSVNLIGGTDAITFEAFIIRKLVPKLWKGACVVMDNCTIHTSEEIEKAIKKKGAKLIYLSPYSPDFSPIEHLWSKLKNILRSIQGYFILNNSLSVLRPKPASR